VAVHGAAGRRAADRPGYACPARDGHWVSAGKWGVQERVRQGNVPVPREHHSWHRGPTSRATATVMHGSPWVRCALAAGGAKAEVSAR